jgi:ribonuclease H / adenosylcobalamin/alpha-ribazole phosphatase
MIRILLIRHAATDAMSKRLCGRTRGIPLSSEGRAQAAALAEGLRGRTLAAIYSSPLERAFETARIVGDSRGMVPRIEERINELDFGDWTGKSFAELEQHELWSVYNRVRSTTTPPGGEPPVEALARIRVFVDELRSHCDRAEIAVVTHSDMIRLLLTSFLGMPLDHLLRFEIAPASVTEVSIGTGYPILHSLNRTFTQRF